MMRGHQSVEAMREFEQVGYVVSKTLAVGVQSRWSRTFVIFPSRSASPIYALEQICPQRDQKDHHDRHAHERERHGSTLFKTHVAGLIQTISRASITVRHSPDSLGLI
jgi:hypothetical protein